MTPLENRLVLHRFLCREFGYDDLTAMLGRLRGAPAAVSPDGVSEYADALYRNPALARITDGRFAEYDEAIVAVSRRLRMTGERDRGWKPHQYLALLFAEHYLRRYFDDAEALRADLNAAKDGECLPRPMPDYTAADLRTVAVQSATGSGKTLVMHAHLLQYRRLARRAGRAVNNVVLVTPNERMSTQHEREFRASGLPARLFSNESGADLLEPVEIVDLAKLAERKGVKRVAVGDFGGNNLVLVDEGHLGASGNTWRERRAELARGGFTFEYSATFNQIAGRDDRLRDAYGKCLLFDYPYRAFHGDGYGKDYAISNLPQGAEDDNSGMYLLGCLLSFYRQCRIWRDGRAGWADFNVTRPLWVFLGKTVTGKSMADRETRSDIVRIVDFLGWVLAHGEAARPMIARLLAGESGLVGDDGADYFAGRFDDLKDDGPDKIYDDVCETLFHGPGRLHVVYLTQGEGELHLRSADNAPFGVVNVGDSAALHKMLVENANPDLAVEREAGFARRLFDDVDREDSTVNVVVGARRFVAGWNSWRVSTMGLMHVGVGEGPEIVQMFGRGVRLKGWRMSLKRHRESGAGAPPDGGRLAELETLRIFGLRANYMQTFRDLLKAEGVHVETETVVLPVTWNFGKIGLKTLRLPEGLKYERSDERPRLRVPCPGAQPVETDLRSRLQFVASAAPAADGGGLESSAKLDPRLVAVFDRTRIYDAMLARKRREGWHNLIIERAAVEELLSRDDWYELRAPPERLTAARYADIRKLEDIAVELIAAYAARFWRARRREWEQSRLEVTTLDESDPNAIREYRMDVDAAKTQLVEDVRDFARDIGERFDRRLQLGAMTPGAHAYRPLLYATGRGEVAVRPVPLDGNERKVVEQLRTLAETGAACLRGHDLFLIRNLSRGRGLSFFDDYDYYPDFIVWLTGCRVQHMVFLDPKGLGRYGRKERAKVRLHTGIKKVEASVRESDPALRLHACILSVTPPHEIGGEPRSQDKWEADGIWFLSEADCLAKVVGHVLDSGAA